MPVITLTSDWGTKDHYLASVKGAILKQMPEARIIDISHHIPPHNLTQAAFILKNCYRDFPPGTIHIIGVSTEESEMSPHTVVLAGEQFFIGADTGIFSLIFDEPPEKIVEIDLVQDSTFFTFSSRDRFVKAAAMLAKGEDISSLGHPREALNEKMLFAPVVDNNVIKGIVIYVDNYKNVITNIRQEKFKEVGRNRKFTISFRGEEINRIHDSYSDVHVGEILALFGCNGHLEIAMNNGKAGNLLGLNPDDPVRIEFYD
ncbi:MAG: SAM-dependent chlorinase/fluorinase [Bacteroidetes bacterium]|nr:SAM-dependent chlorinase/fluorinase [Bacteroidota bacterium]MCK5765257.1 SAM-dependent chlorinase/fluorinase [Bacteroidales bacterium]